MRRSPQKRGMAALMLALAPLAVSACGTTASTASSGASGSAQAASAAPVPTSSKALSGTLTIWHSYNESVPGLHKALGQWEQAFEKANPNVKVTDQYVDYNNISQKIIAAHIAGQGPDLIAVAAGTLPDLYQAGAVLDVTDRWNAYSDKAQFPAAVENGSVYDGHQLGVQAYGNIEGLYVNDDLLAKLGLKTPTNAAEFEADLAAAKAAGYTGFTGVAQGGGSGEFNVDGLMATQGWSYQQPTAPGGLAALQMQAKWVKNGWRSTNDSTGWVATNNFLSGKYLFAQDGNWQMSGYESQAKFKWSVITVPGVYDRAVMGGETWAVGADTKNPDLAWAFITQELLSPAGEQIAAQAESVPLRQDVATSPAVTSNANLAAFAKMASQSIAIPLNKNSGKISTLLGDTYSTMVAGKITANEAWQKISSQLPGLLGQ